MLEIARSKVELRPYTGNWTALFQQEREKLQTALGDMVLDIAHIGSTAIPGCEGKPILDIAVGVSSLDIVDEMERRLQPLGYARLKVQLPDKVVFAKDTDSGRTHYIHVETYNGENWEDQILFRDFLCTHQDVIQQYSELKRRLAQEFSSDISAYTHGKKAFVDKVLHMAHDADFIVF